MDEHEAAATGYEVVSTTISCLITRFKTRSPMSLFRLFFLARRVQREAKSIDGLFTSLFLFENFTTCYTVSLWRDAAAIIRFNTIVRSHVEAANFCFGQLKTHNGRPILWSAQFRLSAISTSNARWEDVEITDANGLSFNSLD